MIDLVEIRRGVFVSKDEARRIKRENPERALYMNNVRAFCWFTGAGLVLVAVEVLTK